MKFLKSYATGLGALMLAIGFIATTLVPERRGYVLSVGLFGLALFVTGLLLDRVRVIAILRGRRSRAAGASLGYILTVLAVLLLVNFLAGRHHRRFDTTENKVFSLSEQTTKILEALPRDVTITAFFQDGAPTKERLKDLMEEYQARSPKLKFSFVDPDSHPADAKRYGITEYGTVVIESGKQEARVTSAEEEALTNALIKVTRDREVTVYVVSGHGERDLKDSERVGLSLLKEALEKQHYTVKPLSLDHGVPADASVVVIAGAQRPFLAVQVAMIRDHLDKGGRLLYLQDPDTDTGFKDLLAAYGIAIRKDVVIDRVSQLFGGDARVPMIPADGYDEFHPITKSFRLQTFYPLASSIDVRSSPPEGVTVTKLAQTSTYSWGETSQEEFRTGRITLNEGVDTKGPLAIGVAIVRHAAAPKSPDGKEPPAKGPPETRLVVFGDSDFVSNASVNTAGNGDLALNSIAWLAEQEDLVSIRPKTNTPRIAILTRQQVFYYFWSIVVLPLVITVVLGVGIWLRRKKL